MTYYILDYSTMQIITDNKGVVINCTPEQASKETLNRGITNYDLLVPKETVDELKEHFKNFKTDTND